MGAAGFGGPHMRNDLSDRVESENLLEGGPGRFWEVRLAIGVRLLMPGTFAARIIVGDFFSSGLVFWWCSRTRLASADLEMGIVIPK